MTRIALAHDPVEVFINIVHPDALFPTYGTEGSAAFDMAPIEDVRLWPGETGLFSTGLVIQAPKDHFLTIVPRSSTWHKWGVNITNTPGIVDEDYCGPDDVLKLSLCRPGKDGHAGRSLIPAGTRLAQGLFVPVTHAAFTVVNGPIGENRGGWGSTGEREFKRHAQNHD